MMLLFLKQSFDILMKQILFLVILIFFASCTQKKSVPDLITEKVNRDQVRLPERLKMSYGDSNIVYEQNNEAEQEFERLKSFQDAYFNKDEGFSIQNFESEWQKITEVIDITELNDDEVKTWFEINSTLLQITGKARYAEKMEEMVLYGFNPGNEAEYKKIEDLVAPYIFTKNVDHIHINLYTPAEIEYEHTLHGKVKIWQETDFPDSGDILINFSMEKNRYIEIAVRIPGWANGATVTAVGVKYPAPPGEYAFIAKKWHEGDTIRIHFPKKSSVAKI